MSDRWETIADALKKRGFQDAVEPGTDLSEIAQRIDEDLAAYIKFRKSDLWKGKEYYKWKVMKSRDGAGNFLSAEFLNSGNASNLCTNYNNSVFRPEEKWKKISLADFVEDLGKLPEDDYQEKINKTRDFIKTHTPTENINADAGDDKKNKQTKNITWQSVAYLLFHLEPEHFFPYYCKALNNATRHWKLSKKYSGQTCYLSWVKLVNDTLLPSLQSSLRSGGESDPVPSLNPPLMKIPLDVYDMMYYLCKYRKETTMPIMRKMKDLLLHNKQLILTGAPGTGKTYNTEQIAAALILPDEEDQHKALQEALKAVAKGSASPEQAKIAGRYEFVQFHSGYDYSDFVQGLKPAVKEGQVTFELRDGLFMRFCKKAAENPEDKYVFVIDEINRADLSRVFGELFFGLEDDYRGKPIKTQYSYLSEKTFTIPPNVYIIGTMNDIDRSVESMDFALRRRFAWYEITAEESEVIIDSISLKDAKGAEIELTNLDDIKESAKQKMKAVNSYIGSWGPGPAKTLSDGLSLNLGKEYQLGGAYFKKIAKYIKPEKKDGKHVGTPDWNSLWENHIAVILREYLRGRKDAEKILDELKKKYDDPEAAPKTDDRPSGEDEK